MASVTNPEGQKSRKGPVGHELENSNQQVRPDERIIIVGAGPVGLLLALLLAQRNIPSTVLEMGATLNTAPRAIGYLGVVHFVFHEAGIFERIAQDGMHAAGYAWRKLPEVKENGDVVLGEIIAKMVAPKVGPEGYPMGKFTIQLAQTELSKIIIEECDKTGIVDVLWNHRVEGLTEDSSGMAVTVETPEGIKELRGSYLVGADGSKSKIRKLLNIKLSGHSWPERFIATDITRTAEVVADPPVHFVVHPLYWSVVTPLEKVEAGKRGRWRVSMAVSDTTVSDEEVLSPEFVDQLLLRQIDGPRPSDHVVERKSLYKMHQLLVSTMHRGRCFLAGDAAHINNPIGGLGLCTGLLDADALAQTFDLVLNLHKPTSLFARYSDERRRVFQLVVHPLSSANKLRLQSSDLDSVAQEDWFFRALARKDPHEIREMQKPLEEGWRSNMRQFAE